MQEPSVVVLVTVPSADKGAEIARTLVNEHLAACVNVLPSIRSIYRWEGRLYDENETLLLAKTTQERFAALRDRVIALHPYEVAEVLALPIEAGSAPYLAWLADSCR